MKLTEQAAGHIDVGANGVDTLVAIRAELDRVIKATVTR